MRAQILTDMCSGNAFHCAADRKCLAAEWRCDYDEDCPSGEDETGCRKKTIMMILAYNYFHFFYN